MPFSNEILQHFIYGTANIRKIIFNTQIIEEKNTHWAMDFWSRLKFIVDAEGVSINKFEDKIGASRGVIAKMLRNKTEINTKWIVAIKENYPHYSLDWLLCGKGEMLYNNAQTADNKFAMELIEKKEAEIKTLERKVWEQEKEIQDLKKASANSTSVVPSVCASTIQLRK